MTITIDLPSDLEQVLRRRATTHGCDLQDIVLEVLRTSVLEQTSETEASIAVPGEISEAEEEPAPWRGVFPIEFKRPPLFSQEITLKASSLPRWQPEVIVYPGRTLDHENE